MVRGPAADAHDAWFGRAYEHARPPPQLRPKLPPPSDGGVRIEGFG